MADTIIDVSERLGDAASEQAGVRGERGAPPLPGQGGATPGVTSATPGVAHPKEPTPEEQVAYAPAMVFGLVNGICGRYGAPELSEQEKNDGAPIIRECFRLYVLPYIGAVGPGLAFIAWGGGVVLSRIPKKEEQPASS